MSITDSILKREERAIFDLRNLYEQYGYKKYKMSKFEEYDLYLENKSFLPSQQVITFTDLSGKLMALKPDVTLSIAKNAPSERSETEKLYYNENVYRTPHGSNEYREIMQVGLECFGDIDLYTEAEAVLLACKSLQKLSEENQMVLSDMGFISGLLESCSLNTPLEARILKGIGHKNSHEIIRLCEESSVPDEIKGALSALPTLYGEFSETLDRAGTFVRNDRMRTSLERLRELGKILLPEPESSRVKLDFSVINDLSYYNGLIFQGFIGGVPTAVISGGRYDKLMERLGKNTQAIGFAVYTDQLERCDTETDGYDVDVLLTYEPDADVSKLTEAVKLLTANGTTVRVQKTKPDRLRYKRLLKFGDRGLEILETNG
ncbi:MAG: ATP phosphoribosyltransferase regulatory subunit [Oscillospiraceae bacterium]|nr:ATP phosphoribosyltransferase regulatory subunit [Oscillospiraceae bacterium]